MRKILPPTAKLSKEAKQTMQECVSEFLSFVTGEASHQCQKEKRKTLTGEDLIWAMASLGFEHYAQALENYLKRYRKTKAELISLTIPGFSDQSSTNDNQRDAREDPHQYYHFHICGKLVEGSSSHNEQ
ncbi:nuclear transcription factor Y subunit B-2-like [Cryptomeria japonica]|uniref:nuclear transcription factor Y subunit B-2-like n=1 Tax=Cryptomeria japonica TaxID=3369 RepID=UPI0027DA64CD|nr:nuclear transcription factor Y subunit B-2-like [Cryptomeria japonica]